jgi:hypothetical protein
MKLHEILNSYQLNEGVNAVVMQQIIYEYVLKKMKQLNPTIHFSYAAELARTTDAFHTDKFDHCKEAFDKAEDIDEIEDALQVAIEAVSEEIIDHFEDPDNHPKGYVARKMIGIDYDTPTREEIDKLVKKIDPTLAKQLENF